jgi:hypothetical protein
LQLPLFCGVCIKPKRFAPSNRLWRWLGSESSSGTCFSVLVNRCLLAKSVRYYLIYINYGKQTTRMTNWQLFIPLLLVFTIDLVLMLVYILPDGLPNRIVTQSTSDTKYLYITCSTNNPKYGAFIIYFFLGYNLFMVLIALLILLMAKNMKTPYSEGTYILFVVPFFMLINSKHSWLTF